MSYATLTVTAKPQPLRVGAPLNPSQGLNAGWTLANNDTINPVWVGTSPGLKANDSGTVIVAPLGSIPVDPTLTSYIVSAGPTVQCFLMPGGGTWAPSPAQIAAQINALGLAKDTSVNAPAYSPITTANAGLLSKASDVNQVNATLGTPAQDSIRTAIPNNIASTGAPLLTLNTNNVNLVNQTLASLNGSGPPTVTITQPSYHVRVDAIDNAAGTQHKTVIITLTWSDSATGKTVQVDQFCFLPGASGTSAHAILGDGPTKGDRCNINIQNNDTVAITYNLTFSQDSKVFTRDLWRSQNNPGATGFTLAGSDLASMILFDTSPTVAAGATATRLMPLWTGQCSISLVPGSGASGPVTFQIWSEDPNAVNWQRPYTFIVQSGAVANNTSIILPNAQCFMSIINNGTASAIMGAWITTYEQ